MNQVWQISSGEGGRRYTDIFLEYDIMFLGPGFPGAYCDEVYDKVVDCGHLSSSKRGAVRSFAQSVKVGDIVLLRDTYHVKAIGIVDGEGYSHNDCFDDVYGWDLQHTHRVVWQDHLTEELKDLQKTSALFSSRKQIPMFTRVHDKVVLEPIRHLFSSVSERPLKPLPSTLPLPLDLEQLGEELFSKGLSNEVVESLIVAMRRQRRLSHWYNTHGRRSGRPTEHEVVAHMILPLLLALGWSEQLLSIEWNKIDLAAFWGTPTTSENCTMVCEAKVLGHGLIEALDQAANYVKKHELNNCKKIMLTDGTRIYVFERTSDSKWNEKPTGYLNINLIRTNHLAPANTNAIDTIMALTPAGMTRNIGG